jgi:hydrogenase maturation protein HypF
MVLRRARGYAPLPILLKSPLKPILTVGGHLKNTIAISLERNVFLSQHIGDLETVQSYNAFQQTIESLKKLYRFKPVICVCDKHPDYLSSKYARNTGLTVVEVQHHFAHILSCMTENEITEKVLGVSWDGTGYGLDGTIWGGEFLQLEDNSFQRIAHFRSFTLPGGEKAVKEPRRSALGVLFEILGDKLFDLNDIATLKTFSSEKLNLIRRMLVKRINSPQTSSAGRLFDAIASLIAVRQVNNFEGQAAMELEFLTTGQIGDESYDFEVDFSKIPYIIDWKAIIYQIMKEVKKGISQNTISIRFHNTLTEIIVALAKKIEEEKIVLSGGCFQNKYLTERTVIRLRNEGFRPYWHQRIPPNDGGIALGQVIAGNLGIRKLD